MYVFMRLSFAVALSVGGALRLLLNHSERAPSKQCDRRVSRSPVECAPILRTRQRTLTKPPHNFPRFNVGVRHVCARTSAVAVPGMRWECPVRTWAQARSLQALWWEGAMRAWEAGFPLQRWVRRKRYVCRVFENTQNFAWSTCIHTHRRVTSAPPQVSVSTDSGATGASSAAAGRPQASANTTATKRAAASAAVRTYACTAA